MDTNNLFEDFKPQDVSSKWEQGFFERLEKQKRRSNKKISAKELIYFSFIVLNLFAIVYSFKNKQESVAADKYRLLSETLFSNNNY